jgi:hypothetical protein
MRSLSLALSLALPSWLHWPRPLGATPLVASPAAEPPAPLAPALPELPAVPGAAPAPAPTAPTTIAQCFDRQGSFRYRAVFRFNVLKPVNLDNRRHLLALFARCTAGEFLALPYVARHNAFKLLRREFQRYRGTAVALADSEHRKRGEPLPRLEFCVAEGTSEPAVKANRKAAVVYRALLEEAMANLTACVQHRAQVR